MSSKTPHLDFKIIRAGAGAGKTQELSNEVLRVAELFLTQTKKHPRIVVTTFTKKATEELRERLLKDACVGKSPEVVKYVSKNKDLHISTIHGVLSLFLRRYGHLVGLDANFQILTDIEAERARKRILRDLILKNKSVVLPTGYRLDEIAEISVRIEHHQFLNQKLKAVDVDTLRDAQENARLELVEEMAKRSTLLAQSSSDAKWSTYFQDFANWCRLLKSKKMDSADRPTKPRLASKAKAPFDVDASEELHDLLKEFDKFSERAMSDEELEKVFATTNLLLACSDEITNIWQNEKKTRGLLEMSDLENLTLEILRKDVGLAHAFAADWDYWLIDEYQDTSPIQEELLQLLSGDKPQFLVGDPQQSIYLFRGARSEVFKLREQKFVAEKKQTQTMMMNYRSRPELLLFLNDFFTSGNPNQFAPMAARTDKSKEPYLLPTIRLVDDASEIYGPLLEEIEQRLTKPGARYDDICILGRQNKELYEIARFLENYKLPVHVHSSSGFYKRQETLDCLTLLKFLVNPMDNENLVRLLRSPWYRVSDTKLIEIAQDRTGHLSYWERIKKSDSNLNAVSKLNELLIRKKEVGVFEVFRQAVCSCGILEWTRAYDATGRRESNIWKLIHLLKVAERKPGFNILNFIRDGILNRTHEEGLETDAVAALEPNRINLMTVHGSKGLKFKHVMIANAHKKPRDIVSRGHEISIVVDEQTGACVVPIRAGDEQKRKQTIYANQILAQIRDRERDEIERMLYVAMTRAQESVVLHGHMKFEKNSWLSFFKGNLSHGEHVLKNSSYQVRLGHGTLKVNPLPTNDEITVPSEYTPPVISEKKSIQRVSVTTVVEEESEKATGLSKAPVRTFEINDAGDLSKEDIEALENQIFRPVLGSYLHRIFEVLNYRKNLFNEVLANGAANSKALQELISDMNVSDRKKISDAIDYCLKTQEIPLATLIHHGEAEWGFQMYSGNRLIEGQIDLWGEVDGVTWVVDYKSGSSGFEKKAQIQLSLYNEALKRFGIKGPIRSAVVYAVEKKIKIFD